MTHAASTYEHSQTRQDSFEEAASSLERSLWIKRTSWGAILAGGVSAIGLQALFTVLGAAIGVTVYEGPSTTTQDVSAFAGIWWVISGTVSLLVGGMIVGRMISIPRNAELMVHGFTMWALTAIFGFMFLWSSAATVSNVGAQSIQNPTLQQSANQALGTDVTPQSNTNTQATANNAQANTVSQAQDTAATASWWTLAALLLGVGAAMGGTYIGASPLGPKENERVRSKP